MSAKRINFGEINPRVKIPDLISIQKKSLAHFLRRDVAPPKRKQEGLQLIFEDAFPIKSYNENVVIEFLEYQLGEPTEEISECRRQSLSYECPLKAKLRLWKRNPKTNRYEGKESGEGIFICWLPVMTEKGSFIINGEERVIVNQLQRSPGVFFNADEEKKMSSYGKRLYTAKIIPQRGAWLEFEFDRDNALFVRIDRKRKVPVSRLLRAAGYGKDEQILGLFYEVEEIPTDKAEGRIIAENIQLPGGENILLSEQLNKGLNLEEMGLAHQQIKLILKAGVKKIKVLKIDSTVNDITMINTVRADNLKTTEQAAHDIYQKLRVQEYITAGVARDFVNKLLFDPAGRRYDLGGVGRYKLNQRLNLKTSLNRRTLTKEDIIATIKYLVSLNNGTVTQIDDIDHLGNRRVKSIGELLENQMRIGFLHMARLIREKINTSDLESITLRDTINTAPVVAIIRSFFGGSQLSQFMDQTNLLAEITHKRRFSALGPGGLNRKRAGFEVRDVHYTQYGRICPVETPEGANIGLITSLATYADVNEYGFITTPYREVVKGQATDKIAYLSADVTDKYIIAQANTPLDEKGKILSKQVSCCHRDEFPIVSPEEVEYIDISPQQIVGLSAGLIPFLEHDDANRALMGSNMQRQAVPLLLPEAPLIATGLESEVVKYSGAVVSCRRRGVVEYVSANKVVVDCRENEKQGRDKEIRQYFDIYELEKYRNSNQNTCINQRPIVTRGQRVKAGDLLADGPATVAGELSLGRDLLVAFMPWEGYNFEDAILMSERVLRDDVFTSIHTQEFEVSARDLRHGNEEITRDIPNVGEESLCNLDEDGIVKIGSWVGPGNILVGKVVPRAHLTTTPEERLLSAIFGRKAEDVEDVSLRVPAGVEGTVIGIDVLSPKKESTVKGVQNINAHYQAKIEHLRQEAKREINELEKVAKENYKKEIQKIKLLTELEIEELKSAKQKAIAKTHSGDKLPIGVNKTVKIRVAIKRPLTVGDKLSGRHGNKGVVSRILPEEDMPYLEDGTPVDIVLNPLSVPSRMNIGQLLETSLGWAAHWLGLKMTCPVFEGASEQQISEYIEKVNKIAEKVNKLKGPVAKIPVLDRAGKTVVYDGHTGEPFDQKVTVGYIYMMKLIHLAEEKMHARSIGPYALITRQPLGGKAQFGGQRLGEMEVWALEGYGAAYTLQEMLTLKSDDVFGRAKMYESIIKGELPFPAGIPESFKVLVKELQSLCLDIKLDGKSLFDSKVGEETFKNFKEIGISIASPEKIRGGSRGEVKKPATINYRTFKPERDGLFCERIFGPTHDYECSCGKYKYSRYKGQKCERCGVEITESKVRRERLGHIDLATPVAHTWFLRKPPSRIAALLEMPLDDIERVVYYAAFIVIEPGDTPLKKCQILTLEEYGNCKQKYGGKFKASTGAGAIRELLAEFSDPEKDVHLPKLRKQLYARLKKLQEKAKNLGESPIANRKLLQRLNVVESFCRTGAQPEWMILQRVPVLPPDLRPLVSLEGGRFAASDLNDLYRRIINRNNRLKHVLELKAPEIMVSNEKRLLQEAVDVLFENGANGKTIVGPGKRPLKCLSDVLQGKRGRFRQNLLGKRVDYSGRAVIVVGPELKMGECGLPKRMAIELFKPFIIKELFQKQIVPSVKAAKRLLEFPTPEIWDVVEKVGKEHLVLLNRAPTLHRLSIQAFKPVLIDGSAIQLHPLVCVPFNADFDGDQMAVHVPVSQEAQAEANFLMVSTGNLLSPAHGQPIISPTQDMVLGCYYLTIDKPEDIGEGMKFSDPSEVLLAYYTREVGLHARIKVRSDGRLIDTTVGRVVFNDIIPKELGFINQPMDKKVLAGLVETCYRKLGNYRTMLLLDDLKRLGFKYATRSGLSIAVEDLKIPEEKEKLLQESDKKIEKVKQYYHQGEITNGERYQRTIDIWTYTTQKISRMMVKGLKEINEKPYVPGEDKFNSIYLLINSGARGTEEQVKQLAAIRGLMAKPQKKILGLPGEIIEFPIRSNFREGLTVLEYFISTHGGRKGLADTALKTSDAGYLTRKLIDVSHNVVVNEEDCGTTDGITVSAIRDSEGRIIESLYKRILGRMSLKNIVDPFADKVLVKENETITEESAERIELVGIEQVRIRSVLTCQAKRGVCSKCYGRDLATGKLVRTGMPAGIIAAQSIGEPGTQLTLRTFHIGGTAGQTIRQYSIQSDLDGKARFSNLRTLVNRDKKMINISRDAEVSIKPPGKPGQTYSIPYGATVWVKDGERVKKGAQIAEWIPFMMPIIAETEGMARFKDIIKGKTVYEEINKTTGLKERVIIEHREGKLHPQIVVVGKQGRERKYLLPMDTHIVVNNGDRICKGDILAKIPQMVIQIKDITGGLPRVTELFEARRPRNAAIITEIDGKVHLSGTARRKFIVEVIPERGQKTSYSIPPGRHLVVYENDWVRAGEQLTDGSIDPHDILKVKGVKEAQEYLVSQVQATYTLQGVNINDKHIEAIVRRMFDKVLITEKGNSDFLPGERVDKFKFTQQNDRLSKQGKSPASASPLLLGITHAALESESFVSGSSFQETSSVLTEASVKGKSDPLEGLKENVIIGRLIPAGTGMPNYRQVKLE